MMNVREVSDWFRKEKERLLHEAEDQAEAMKKRAGEARRRRKSALESELVAIELEMDATGSRIASMPPVYLHNRFDMTTKQRMKNLLAGFDNLENFLASGFNRGLLSFGSPWFTTLSIIASMALAFQWMQNRFGVDGIGGSEVMTIIVTAVLALALDLVSFMLLGGVLAGLKNFLTRERHVGVLATTIVGGALIGVVGFGIILIQRFMEAGI